MVAELILVMKNPSIDPERRLRWVTEIAGQLTSAYPKALAGKRIEDLERQVVDLTPVQREPTADEQTQSAMTELADKLRLVLGRTPDDDDEGGGGNGHGGNGALLP
jgi:hypothetical protein